jgi:hypothetical protein
MRGDLRDDVDRLFLDSERGFDLRRPLLYLIRVATVRRLDMAP